MKTLITREKNPRVTMLIGKNKIFNIGLIVLSSKVKTKPVITKVIELLYLIFGKNQAKIAMVKMETMTALINFTSSL